MADLSPGSVFAGYRIDEVAGQGGMGVVLRATQIALERPVALKVIIPDLADDVDFRARFKRESLLAASIDHPNVIPVYEAGESDGRLFIAMRWVEGRDGRSLISSAGSLPPERAVAIVERVGAALDAAHSAGLVHRDVKPANVLIASGPEEHVYLTDFGLTKRTTSAGGMTRTGHFVGTADYAAPEQIRGESADARADVYALGCLLYQAITGRVPFDRDSEVAKIYAHLNDPPPRVSSASPDVPPGFDSVVERALAKDPDDRYPSAGDLGRAARAALTNAPAADPERSLATGLAAPAEERSTAVAGTVAASTRLASESAEAPSAPATVPLTPTRAKPRRSGAVWAVAGLLALAALAGVLVVLFAGGDESSGGDSSEFSDAGAGAGGGSEGGPPSLKTVPAGDGPDGITVSGETVFVANSLDGAVSRLDAATGERAAAPLEVGTNPDGVVIGDDVAWVTNTDDGSVTRVPLDDADGGRAFIEVGREPEGIALGEQLVWVANSEDDTVTRIDRASPETVGSPIKVGDFPIGVVVNDQVVWVTNSFSDTVTRIDASSSEILGDQIQVGDEPRGVAAGLGFVWVVNKGDDTVTRLDPDTGKPAGNPTRVGKTPKEVAVGLGSAWVANTVGNTVTRIDASGKVVGDPIPVGSTPVGIAVGAGAVWVSNNKDDTVTKITP